jgi:hypothetical protein
VMPSPGTRIFASSRKAPRINRMSTSSAFIP